MDVAPGLQAGDIGLVRAPRGAMGYPAHWLGQRYEHAFLVGGHYYQVGEWIPPDIDLNQGKSWRSFQFVIEAGWTGVTLAELEPRVEFCDFVRPKYSIEQLANDNIHLAAMVPALRAACRHEPYSYANLVRLAWQRLILRRKPPELAVAAVICTQGVAQWWRAAGFDPVPGIADWAILPDDFWNSPAVERLEYKEGRWSLLGV